MLTDLEKEIFSKMEREQELNKKLVEQFPEYDFVIQIKEFLEFLDFVINQIDKTIESLKGEGFSLSKDLVMQSYKKFRRLYFIAYSLHQHYECYLYDASKAFPNNKDFHVLIDSWKHDGIVVVTATIRDRLQHGAPLDGTLFYEYKIVSHDGDKKMKCLFELESTVWTKMIEKLSGNDKAIAKRIYDKEILSKEDKLLYVIKQYRSQTEELCTKLEKQFEKAFVTQVTKRKDLLKELDDLNDWFMEKGLAQP